MPAKRGFAAMDPAKQREIASRGGKASRSGSRSMSARGAAGSTAAAKRGGQNSRRG